MLRNNSSWEGHGFSRAARDWKYVGLKLLRVVTHGAVPSARDGPSEPIRGASPGLQSEGRSLNPRKRPGIYIRGL